MTCRVFTSADGEVRAIVCSRGRGKPAPRRFCVVCLKDGRRTEAALLCDHPKPGGGTCDAGLCVAHTNRVRPGTDWCPAHTEAP
ncbi:MAG: hypothetical protein WC969_14960 [Elusimicrobiota bacterium]